MTVESKLPRRASVAALVFVLSSCGATLVSEGMVVDRDSS
jgi:hypothetical protein